MLFPNLYAAVRGHKWVVILGPLVCVIAAVYLTSQQVKLYEASAVVRVDPQDENSGANQKYEAAQRLARSYAEVYQRGAVNKQIQKLLADPGPIGEDELVASQVKDLDLLSVGALTEDPARSARIANNGWQALEGLSRNVRLVLVTPAVIPDSPASPNLPLNIALALFGGIILSVGLALLLQAVRQPIPDADALEQDFGQPVIAVVPRLRFSQGPAGRTSPFRRVTGSEDASGLLDASEPAASERSPGSRANARALGSKGK